MSFDLPQSPTHSQTNPKKFTNIFEIEKGTKQFTQCTVKLSSNSIFPPIPSQKTHSISNLSFFTQTPVSSQREEPILQTNVESPLAFKEPEFAELKTRIYCQDNNFFPEDPCLKEEESFDFSDFKRNEDPEDDFEGERKNVDIEREFSLSVQTTPILPEHKFHCDECGKAYTRMSALKLHKRKHISQKPYVCPYCNAKFSENGNLKTHIRIHFNDRPYKCKFPGCGKSFIALGHLNDHIRCHTNERPYCCKFCFKRFKRSNTLKSHEKIHMNQKKEICHICKKAFSSHSNLKTHLRTHTGERPFECIFQCNKKFKTKGHLIDHLRIQDHHIEVGMFKYLFIKTYIFKSTSKIPSISECMETLLHYDFTKIDEKLMDSFVNIPDLLSSFNSSNSIHSAKYFKGEKKEEIPLQNSEICIEDEEYKEIMKQLTTLTKDKKEENSWYCYITKHLNLFSSKYEKIGNVCEE